MTEGEVDGMYEGFPVGLMDGALDGFCVGINEGVVLVSKLGIVV